MFVEWDSSAHLPLPGRNYDVRRGNGKRNLTRCEISGGEKEQDTFQPVTGASLAYSFIFSLLLQISDYCRHENEALGPELFHNMHF